MDTATVNSGIRTGVGIPTVVRWRLPDHAENVTLETPLPDSCVLLRRARGQTVEEATVLEMELVFDRPGDVQLGPWEYRVGSNRHSLPAKQLSVTSTVPADREAQFGAIQPWPAGDSSFDGTWPLLGVALILALLWSRSRARAQRATLAPAPPSMSRHEVLARLRSMALSPEASPKEIRHFVREADRLLCHFVAAAWGCPARRQTAEERFRWLQQLPAAQSFCEPIRQWTSRRERQCFAHAPSSQASSALQNDLIELLDRLEESLQPSRNAS